MTQNEVEAFLSVIECGSISAAAKKLYLGQPTVSARIQSLEDELGATLFSRRRGQKRTELTLVGKSFEPYARKWISLWDETQTAITTDVPDSLCISMVHSISSYIIPDIFMRLSSHAKKCSYKIMAHAPEITYKNLENRETDIGIVPYAHYAWNFNFYPLYKERLVLMYNKSQKYAKKVDPSTLDVRKEIYVEWDEHYARWHTNHLGAPITAALRTDDVILAQRCLEVDDNWSVMPITVAKYAKEHSTKIDYTFLKDEPNPRLNSLVCKGEWQEHNSIKEILTLMKEGITRMGGEWLLQL